MKVAYISGPYRGKTENEVVANIKAAEVVAIKYWRLGYAVICPHKNTALFDGICSEDVFLEGDIEIMKRCDVVVMMKEWRNSSGARKELEIATRNGLAIIYE